MDSINQVQHELLSRMQHYASLAEGQMIAPAAAPSQQAGVVQSFEAALRAVDADQHRASAATAAVSSGESDDLVGAMVESLKASTSFSALMQVRNKVTTAFDDIMRMPL